ncbi:MAG: VCBS repeat-containing protein [Planctomycetes bacterium]|nr:VCBS repeat-containing protein [Planctomycetota bacterium]
MTSRNVIVALIVVLSFGARAGAAVDFTTATPSGVQAHTVAFQNLTTGSIVSWQWDFGDGGTSSKKNPTHTYMEVGSYTVSLQALGFGGAGGTETKVGYIVVTPASLTADFTTSATSGVVPLTVDFAGTASGTGNITDWTWDFGDGHTASGQDVQHAFKSSGLFTVALTVWAGEPIVTETKVDLVDVTPLDMQASFTATPISGYAPLAVQFTDTSTGPHNHWSWVFDDGPTPWWASLQNPVNTYTVPGVYDVTLTIGQVGVEDSATVTLPGAITVLDPELTPGVEAFPRGGLSPLTVTLTDTSSALVPFTRDLDFGDLSPHTALPTSTHVYTGTRPFTPVQTLTTIPGPNTASFDLVNGVECVEPEVATFTSFGEPELGYLGAPVGRLATGDFSGDGLPDLAVEPLVTAGPIAVYVQQGGSFSVAPQTFQPAATSGYFRNVAGAADMDEDGELDLVLTPRIWTHGIGIYRGNGAGGFSLASEKPLPGSLSQGSTWGALLDVDEDGHIDVVVGADDVLRVGFGTGHGGIASFSAPGETLAFQEFPEVVDLDHDGHADLVGLTDTGEVRSLRGTGAGFAPSTAHVFGASSEGASFDAGDVTGDGFVDLVVHDGGDLLVAQGTGAGFSAFVPHALAFAIDAPFVLGDLDGDGDADMLSSSGRDLRATRFASDGSPAFSSGLQRHASAESAEQHVLLDLDADGDLDLLTRYVKVGEQKFVTVHRNLGVIGRWVDIGGEMTGVAGTLHFEGAGELRGGTPVTFTLSGAQPSSPAYFVIGLSEVLQPFKGGVLVPSVDVVVGLPTDALGGFALQTIWPSGVPATTPSWYQTWVSEGGTLAGSNGVLAIAAD